MESGREGGEWEGRWGGGREGGEWEGRWRVGGKGRGAKMEGLSTDQWLSCEKARHNVLLQQTELELRTFYGIQVRRNG